ncbi:MAG: ester cyclase [Gemmatimonadota bacterium]|nr:ester cyclase [Gemmatimonadota bacterium]
MRRTSNGAIRTAAVTVAVACAVLIGCAQDESTEPADATATAESREEVVEAYARAFNARKWGALDTLLAEDYTRHSQPRPEATIRSDDDFLRWARRDAEVFEDPTLDLEKLVSESDHVAFWAEYSGRQVGKLGPFPSRGEEVELSYSGMHRIEDGKIAETWVTWDNMSALVQLGHWETRPASDLSPRQYCAVRIPRGESIGELAGS